MARGAVEEPLLVGVGWIVLSADRVVGTEAAEFQGALEVALDVPPDVHQTTEGPLGPAGPGVEQDPETVLACVDPLADGAGRVTTLQGDGGNQEVREAVEHEVGEARKGRVMRSLALDPGLETRQQVL